MSEPNRRLSDKILAAFNQACDQGKLEVAEHLLRALELALTKVGQPGAADKRDQLGPVALAHERLRELRQAVLDGPGRVGL